MKEGYLRLLEEHKQKENVNLFQKVLTMTKRAKSLYSLEESARSSLKHKPMFQVITWIAETAKTLKKGSKN